VVKKSIAEASQCFHSSISSHHPNFSSSFHNKRVTPDTYDKRHKVEAYEVRMLFPKLTVSKFNQMSILSVIWNGLHLNTFKTKSLQVTRKKSPPILSLYVRDSAIEAVSHTKYLARSLSLFQPLLVKPRIRTLQPSQAHTGFPHFRQATCTCLNCIYQATVVPTLDYCARVWDPQDKGIYIRGVSKKIAPITTPKVHLPWGTLNPPSRFSPGILIIILSKSKSWNVGVRCQDSIK